MSVFWMELRNSNSLLNLLEGDGVLVSTEEMPAANGKDIGVFELGEERFLSRYTRYGAQILLLDERIQVVRQSQINLVGKVVAFTNEKEPSHQR